MTTLRTCAPAKVNLGLQVVTRRPDGYHELRSVFLRIGLADELALADGDGPRDTLVVDGDPACPVEGNLALRAVAAIRSTVTADLPPVAIRLRKRIPLEAGLAGGSSDAAAVLRLLAHRHPGMPDGSQRIALAASLGADVPFFLSAAGAALVRGIGEGIEPLPPPIEPLGVLLVRPRVGLPTARVFGAWDAHHPGDGHPGRESDGAGAATAIDELAAQLRGGASPQALVALAPRLRDANDLWAAAVVVEPRMARFRDALEARLGRPVLMTGSGSTLVALLDGPASAMEAAESLRADLPAPLVGAWVAASASGTPYPPMVDIEEERP
ncbi:MAG: 4-(cytidine 5'-diphospho)-2-C-methyl-D-erythritol kinase [Chloroflexota bacterium]